MLTISYRYCCCYSDDDDHTSPQSLKVPSQFQDTIDLGHSQYDLNHSKIKRYCQSSMPILTTILYCSAHIDCDTIPLHIYSRTQYQPICSLIA